MLKAKVEETINRVLNSSDPYKILNVKNDSTDDEIEKSYKRLCLILHPDQCKHPKSEQAFKKVNNCKNQIIEHRKRQSEFRRDTFFTQNYRSPFSRQQFHGGNFHFTNFSNEDDFFETLFRQHSRYRAYSGQEFFNPFANRRGSIIDTQDDDSFKFVLIVLILAFLLYFGG
ncbi:putative Heat shock protein DnaJ, Molecular chaperone, heat shock protein, Hsp40, DnaJ protein [Pseudoloma neurophilia]|uniref:Putative Heat shock protein DnaJ, Molecular chaperone, heat shock protein, Hsp40, DnaJ protein n=1 Tax=Pseudoloma neurophilia TaxID=146866 RepID=A0A0R0LUE2_9MICR|nr:putative Heat shock protein DnaJ, Molecular chaperone, heat shock protein, Hsp40, DnaJ protein [Pseudoloma neurophilia]